MTVESGEVSPEEAHEIGMQLAKEILGGKYEFVLQNFFKSFEICISLSKRAKRTFLTS